jgi:hypothetical protein
MEEKESVGLKEMIEIMKYVRLLCSAQHIVMAGTQIT